ncbi:GNAT family N-acetyltransferase [Propioniciclava soli]|uniref:GNAT family N-acetyltransferase n=1 Tax=Propioniciclava soli TaxID=2775081 RepID=UPI001E3C9DE0|nr:GNAT family N-acetyltransferase [Propioniciclava soli]
MVTIKPVPTPAPGDDTAHPWVEAMAALDGATCRELYGHDDFNDSVAARVLSLRGSPYWSQDVWVALDGAGEVGDPVLGYVGADQPLREDPDTASLDLTVTRAARRRGVGTALLNTAAAALAAQGRTTLLAWAFEPGLGPDGDDGVAASSGTGAVDPRRPSNAFLLRHGFTLEQVERPSTLTLDEATLTQAQRHAEVARVASGDDYELVGWDGPAPDAFAEGRALLEGRMSTDVPLAEELGEAQAWDVARLRSAEQRMLARERGWVTSAARHRGSGELVAFTLVEWPGHNPAGVWQEGTLVHPDHRGHRLGMLVKAANLLRLRRANPHALRVHTWNAAENAHMLAINDALGFAPTGLEGAWRRR